MIITSHLFEAYLKCPTKCFLRSRGEVGTGNAYSEWFSTQSTLYQIEGIRRLRRGVANDECESGPLGTNALQSATWRLATESTARAKDIESTVHATERVPSDAPSEPAQFVPIRFVLSNKLTRHDKLLLTFDALALSGILRRDVNFGKIIHGQDHTAVRVTTASLTTELRGHLAKAATLLSSLVPPDLVLNRHCAECEFQKLCRQKAMDEDDLSLLGGITEDERQRYRSKGIFTVKQLSYTFRPRRTSKRAKNPARPRYPALQALAIRENTIYIHGSPKLSEPKTRVYLDIEGTPDSDSYYLIGLLIVSENEQEEVFHSFWADQLADEPEMFSRFLQVICQLDDYQVLHFGDYECVALRRMKAKLPIDCQARIDALLGRMTNVLSIIHPHLYFPTYSNALKDIGRFLGFKRVDEDAVGLHAVVWRRNWDNSRDPDVKARLLLYNRDDCRELKHITDFIRQVVSQTPTGLEPPGTQFKVAATEDLATPRPRWDLFRPKKYALDDLEKVAKCAYFDYQREKVVFRTHPHLKAISKKHRMASIRVNEVSLVESDRCPDCRSKRIEQCRQMSHVEIDLKFFRGGVKKWTTRTLSWRYRCSRCQHEFTSEERLPNPQRYGHGLASWCVYSNVACGMNMMHAMDSLADIFGIVLPDGKAYRLKRYMVRFYGALYSEIQKSIMTSSVIHIDETTVRLRKESGYVWVITTMDKVYYFYKQSREGTFLKGLFEGFSGVLVSDFYSAYDSLKCEQQKCLVHFVRDIDDDLLKNPLDAELTNIAQAFGTLLRCIIETVDKRGLKSRYLRKHRAAVLRFFKSVASSQFASPLANKYKKRFEKSGDKMFTFLNYDGVPWNNNNAEHAIKRFAKYRRDGDGRFTTRTIEEYLVLATVFETCEFNNINVLRFLLSKERTLDGLLGIAKSRVRDFKPSGTP